MEQTCLNCKSIIITNFCEECGQKKFKRIDRTYVWEEIQYTFLHTNKGFLYSVKNIIKNPGKTAREFIDGNRINHYKPILLVFLLSGISAFISFKIIEFNDIMKSINSKNVQNSELMNDYMTLLSSYSAFFMLLSVPFFAVTTKLAFRSWGHNFYEHVVMNAYILSFYTLFIIIIFSPLLYIFKDNEQFIMSLIAYTYLPLPFILFWFFKEFYKDKSGKSIFLRVLLTLVIVFVGFILMMIFFVIVGIIFAMFYGPEALEYIAPKPK